MFYWSLTFFKKLEILTVFLTLQTIQFFKKMTLAYFVDICPPDKVIVFVVISEKIKLCATSYSTNLELRHMRHISKRIRTNGKIKANKRLINICEREIKKYIALAVSVFLPQILNTLQGPML